MFSIAHTYIMLINDSNYGKCMEKLVLEGTEDRDFEKDSIG